MRPGGSIVRTALGTALRDRKMDDCVWRGLLQFIDKANCALGIVQALRGLLPRPSRPIRHRSTTFIAPPSTIHRALNCRIERARDFSNNPRKSECSQVLRIVLHCVASTSVGLTENIPILTPVRNCSGPKKTEHNRAVLLRCMQCHEIDMILNAPKMQIFAVECTKTIA